MNTHDIEPLKYGGNRSDDYVTGWNDCYAAIEADRKRRGEPVAWYTEDHLTDRSATTYDPIVAERWRVKGWPVSPLFKGPQPAEPVNSDRRMLLELMEAFDIETWQCPRCGHAEDTATMDSANTLRNYLQRSRGAEPVEVPSDAEMAAIWDEAHKPFGGAPFLMSHVEYSRALLAHYGQTCPHCTPVDGKHGPRVQQAWNAGWDAAQEAHYATTQEQP